MPQPRAHNSPAIVSRIGSAQTWTLRLGVFLLPLAYSPATYDGFVLPKLLLARLLVAVLLVLWVAQIAFAHALVVKRTPLDVPLLLFLGSAALSTVFAENRNVAIFGTYTRYDGLLTLITYAALFWLSVQSLTGLAEARGLIRALLAGGYVVSVVAILQCLHDSSRQGSIAPAYGTMGNPNVLGAYLALVVTLAAGELLVAKSAAGRVLIGNVLVISLVALALSLSRSAWLGTLAGLVLILAARHSRKVIRGVAVVAGVLVALLAVGYLVASPGQLEHTVAARALSIVDPREIAHSRIGIWTDSLRLIASRPILGYGPDNVGLVFPRFQSGDWGYTYSYTTGNERLPIDKTHAELLQVAATQGLLGVAGYLLLQLAFLRELWRARAIDQAVIAGAGWIAYTLVLQLNFTALAAALPFWLFAGAAVVSCDAVRQKVVVRFSGGRAVLPGALATAGAVVWFGVVLPYIADARLLEAVELDSSGRAVEAGRLTVEARQLAPWESVYAVEAANLAFGQSRWADAREGYRSAAALGTFNPLVYRNLALTDLHLGLGDEARGAAQEAVRLDPYDPANQALWAQFATTKT